MKAVFDWIFDIAADRAEGNEQQVHAILATRLFLRAWLDGLQAQVRVADLISTAATIFAELELDLGIDSSALMRPLLDASVAVIAIPGVSHEAEATVRMSAVVSDSHVKFTATAA
ncbi:MAG TPA: hypothetical protein VGM88_16805 [Kofleriaceae bacterium]